MRAIWRWVGQHATPIVVGALLVLSALAIFVPLREPEPVGASIQMSFGLDREPLTRTFLIDACSPQDAADPACGDRDNGRSSSATSSAERPAIVATSLQGDLVGSRCEAVAARNGSEAASATGTGGEPFQFPADQVAVTAELRGSTGIEVTVAADPWKPEQVPGGTYCQFIVIERDSGPYYQVGLAISLVDRDDNLALFKAVWALAVGALIGVLVRLLNDPLGSMIRLRRRHRALARAVQQMSDPTAQKTALDLLREAGDAMADLDVEDSRKILEEVERLLKAGTTEEQAATLQRAQRKLEEVEGRATVLTKERALFRLLDRYWVIGISLIVVLVVVTGLQTLYVGNPSFNGRSAASWLGLIAFGLAAQITVGTLADAAGKLSPSGAAGRGSG